MATDESLCPSESEATTPVSGWVQLFSRAFLGEDHTAGCGQSSTDSIEQQDPAAQQTCKAMSTDAGENVPAAGRVVSLATTLESEDGGDDATEQQSSSATPSQGEPSRPPSPGGKVPIDEVMAFLKSTRATLEASRGSGDDASSQPDACASGKASKKLSASQPGRMDLNLLTEHLKSGQSTLAQIRGKDVLLVLGRTGAGKSTFLQRIAGRTLQRATYTYQDDVFEVVDPLEGFVVGHGSKSRTKSINHLSMASVHPQLGEIIYIDSPGFEDTSGPEADAATSLAIVRVAEQCRSLRLVVLVNSGSFFPDRGTAVRSLMELVSSFLPEWYRHRFALSFLFAHTDFLDKTKSKSVPELRGLLQKQLEELSGNTHDLKTKGMLEWLEECLVDKEYGLVDVFHPQDSELQSLRSGLEAFQSFAQKSSGEPIFPAIGLREGERCSNVVRCGLTEACVNKISAELQALSNEVEGWLGGHEFGKLAENLGTVKILYEQMKDISVVGQAAERVINKIRGHAKKLLNEVYATMHGSPATSSGTTSSPVTVQRASNALRDLARLDAWVRLPVLQLGTGKDGETGQDGVLDEDAAPKAIHHLAERLLDHGNKLMASPLNAPSSASPSASPAAPTSDDDGKSNCDHKSSDTQTTQDKAQNDLPALLEPLTPDHFESLLQLATWEQALTSSLVSGSSELDSNTDSNLPGLRQHAKTGLGLLPRYVEKLRDVSMETTGPFLASCRRKASSLARLLELGNWLSSSLLDFHEFFEISALQSAIRALEGEIQELLGKTLHATQQSLDGWLEFCRSNVGRVPELWASGNMKAELEVLGTSIGNFLHLAAALDQETSSLQKLNPSLYDSYQQGLATIELRSEQLLESLHQEASKLVSEAPENGPLGSSSPSVPKSPTARAEVLNSSASVSPEAMADLLNSLSNIFRVQGGRDLASSAKHEADLKKYISNIDALAQTWKTKLDIYWSEGKKRRYLGAEAAQQLAELMASLDGVAWREAFRDSTTPSTTDSNLDSDSRPASASAPALASESEATPETSGTSGAPGAPAPATLEVKKSVLQRVEGTSGEVLKALGKLLELPLDSQKQTDFLELHAEREHLQVFGASCPEVAGDMLNLKKKISELVNTWREGQLRSPVASIMTSGSLFEKELESVFVLWDVLLNLEEQHRATLKSLRDEADQRLDLLRQKVGDLMKQQGSFDDKKRLLDSLGIWTSLKMDHVLAALPTKDGLLEELRQDVGERGRRIREELVANELISEAGAEVQSLESALCLDEYLSGAVQKELSAAKHRLDTSRFDIGSKFKVRIDACEFEGLEARLQEFQDAETEEGQARAEELFKLIADRVVEELSQAWANIEDGEKIAACLEKLEKAFLVLQPFHARFTDLDIEASLENLTEAVTQHFTKLLEQFKKSRSPTKLRTLVEHQRSLVTYHQATKQWLEGSAHEDAEELMASAAQCLDLAESLATCFVSNLALSPDFHTGYTELIASMKQLKECMDASGEWGMQVVGAQAPQTGILEKQWVVVGGFGDYGIPVRTSSDPAARQADDPFLQHGAVVMEISRSGNLLEYRKLKGRGPPRGWVAISDHDGREAVAPALQVRRALGVRFPKSNNTCLGGATSLAMYLFQRGLTSGTLVRVREQAGGRISYKKLSGHAGPEEGWEYEVANGQPNFKNVVVDSAIRLGLKPAITVHGVTTCYNKMVECLSKELELLHRACPVSEGHPVVLAKVICIYPYLIKGFQKGLSEHVRLSFQLEDELNQAEAERTKHFACLQGVFKSVEELENVWSSFLGAWPSPPPTSAFFQHTAYGLDMEQLLRNASKTLHSARAMLELNSANYRACGQLSGLMLRMQQLLASHEKPRSMVQADFQRLGSDVEGHQASLINQLCEALRVKNASQFEKVMFSHHRVLKHLKSAFPKVLAVLPTFHSKVAGHIVSSIKSLQTSLEQLDLEAAGKQVEALRRFGHVLAGIWTVYAQTLQDTSGADPGFSQVNQLASSHFSGDALLNGCHYAVLQLSPEAQAEDVKRAFEVRCRVCKADTFLTKGPAEHSAESELKALETAKGALLDDSLRASYRLALGNLFSGFLNEIPARIQASIETSLREANYHRARGALDDAMKSLPCIAKLVTPTIDPNQCLEAARKAIKRHSDQLCQQITTCWNQQHLRDLNVGIGQLEKVDAAFAGLYSPDWRPKLQKIIHDGIEAQTLRLSKTVDNMAKYGQDPSLSQTMSKGLLYLARIMDEVPSFKDPASDSIGQILNRCQDDLGPTFVFRLGMLLEQGTDGGEEGENSLSGDERRVARVMLNSFRQFRDILTVIWNQQTAATQRDLPSTLEEIKSHKVNPSTGARTPFCPDASRLKAGVDRYNEAYESHLMKWKAGQLECDQLVSDVKAKAQRIAPGSVKKWGSKVLDELPEILAAIGAFFTISKSGESFSKLTTAGSSGLPVLATSGGSGQALDASTILQRPHIIQILALLKIFGFDSPSSSLEGQLLQIRTGEGKSMILGMCSLLFGLLGFRVRCVCYSEYLSERDRRLFEDLFKAFGVEALVTYSKITAFSEDKVAERGDIRQLTAQMLLGQAGPQSTSATNTQSGLDGKEEILLLDEVDMFFGVDFYGRTHDQVAALQLPEVSQLLELVWQLAQQNPQLTHSQLARRARSSQQYLDLSHRFSGFAYVVDREISQMCADVREFSTPAYHCDTSGNRIGYKDMDAVCYDIVYGYRTAFAYLHEAERRNFQNAEVALNKGLRLRVSCGQFCYSKINPACILGVSGTLSALGPEEWKIMGKYQIKGYSTLPTVYGENRLKFWNSERPDPITLAKTRADHFLTITEQVKQMTQAKRAVIVLFESAELLKQYEQSSYFSQVKYRNILSEDKSHDEKDFVIKKAATAGQATFTTAVFGRGTDFLCNDQRVLQAGGVHIIHAFFSLDKSEEIQIQGRTARQGNCGTYCMVLCEADLKERFGLPRSFDGRQIRPQELYKYLNEQRSKLQRTKHEELQAKLGEAEERHRMTTAYFEALLRGEGLDQRRLFKDLFDKIAQCSGSGTSSAEGNHIIFCLDKSGSMAGHPWNQLQVAFAEFLAARPNQDDMVSVVLFDHWTYPMTRLQDAASVSPEHCLRMLPGGQTNFVPVLRDAEQLLCLGNQHGLVPVLILMSDGINHDGDCCSQMQMLAQRYPDLQSHMVFFGTEDGQDHLRRMAAAAGGRFHLSVDGIALQETFRAIAVGAECTR